jgi:hypothetical protein
MTDTWSQRGREFVADLVAEHGGRWPAPEPGDFAGHDLTDAQAEWLAAQATGHPARTIFEPAALSRPVAETSATYLACLLPSGKVSDEVEGLRTRPDWHIETLDTGHWPMVSAPDLLVELLVNAAARG